MRRAVLLGASNLALDLPSWLALARADADDGGDDGSDDGPLEAFVACGLGRSYGTWSSVLGLRALPGIVDSGLWQALAALEPLAPAVDDGAPTLALIADIGNDIVYGAAPERIAGWVATCLERLAARGARMALVLPPVAVVAALPRWRFLLARTLLYPGRRTPLDAVRRRTEALAERLREVAARYGAVAIAPDPAWYGLDPVHPRAAGRRALRRAVLVAWGMPSTAADVAPGLLERLRLAVRPAHGSRLLGLRLTPAQPCLRDPDGSTVSLY